MNRSKLETVGNMNGKDVYCEECGEPWENAWIVEEATDAELRQDVIYGNYPDDDGGEDESCIIGLKAYRCCHERD